MNGSVSVNWLFSSEGKVFTGRVLREKKKTLIFLIVVTFYGCFAFYVVCSGKGGGVRFRGIVSRSKTAENKTCTDLTEVI